MIQYEALFKLSYGLYIVSAGDQEKSNGFISNTIFQVTAEPPMFANCCNKNNYTSELILRKKSFGVSILSRDTDSSLIAAFGYKSGKDGDKMSGMTTTTGSTGVPIVLNHCVAWMECDVVQTIDLGTHWLFVGKLLNAVTIDDEAEPLTYKYYRDVKKGTASKNAPTYVGDKISDKKTTTASSSRRYKCLACGFIYDDAEEEVPFEELPEDWTCPICGADKNEFIEL